MRMLSRPKVNTSVSCCHVSISLWTCAFQKSLVSSGLNSRAVCLEEVSDSVNYSINAPINVLLLLGACIQLVTVIPKHNLIYNHA